jgi:hypothetical protein
MEVIHDSKYDCIDYNTERMKDPEEDKNRRIIITACRRTSVGLPVRSE